MKNDGLVKYHDAYKTGRLRLPAGPQRRGNSPEASILAVANVVESMASHRPYRLALGLDAALE